MYVIDLAMSTLPCPPASPGLSASSHLQSFRRLRLQAGEPQRCCAPQWAGGFSFVPWATQARQIQTKQLAGLQHKGGEVEHLNIYCTGCSDDAPPYVNRMIICPCPVWHTQIPCRQTIGILERPHFFGRWRQYLAAGCKLQSLIPAGLPFCWAEPSETWHQIC